MSHAEGKDQFLDSLLEIEIADLNARAKSLIDEKNELISANRIMFTAPRGVNARGWIAVVEADRITAAQMGMRSVPTVFQRSLFLSEADQFLKWNRGRNPAVGYWLILIRPGGAEAFSEIQAEFNRKNITFGFDLLGNDQTVIHPERGTAP